MLTKQHKSKRILASIGNICNYHDKGEPFVESTIIGDEM
jgi:hypothetical protein